MAVTVRIDSAPVGKAVKLDNGFLRVPARLTRSGVFEYRLPNGKIRRELRPPDEVFNQDSLASFELLPFVDDHPAQGKVTAENAAQFIAGAVGKIRQDGDFVEGEVLVQHAATITKIEAGKHELSCGYTCDMDETPGVWNGQKYDAIQRNIRGNHVALVDQGRAGPEVKLRLDSLGLDNADVGMLASATEQMGSPIIPRVPMHKFKIDGVDYEIPEQAAQAITKERAAAAAAADALKAERDAARSDSEKQKARADAAEQKVGSLEKELAAAPVKLAARAALESTAKEFLGKDVKFDGVSDVDVRKRVLVKLTKTDAADLASKSDAYVEARFDHEVENARKENPASREMRERLERGPRNDGADLTPEQKFQKAVAERYLAKA